MENVLTVNHLEQFEIYLHNEEKSAATVEKYLRDVRAFFRFLDSRKITKEEVCAYKSLLEKNKYAPRSINSMLASVNSMLKWMGLEECRVKTLRVQKKMYCEEKKELTKQEYLCLLEVAKGRPQLRMILETLAGTGIRVSELHFFTLEAVKAGQVDVKCKSKIRTILIPGKLRKKLCDYAKKKGIRKGHIFITRTGKPLDRSNIWKWMKQLCKKAGVSEEKGFPHNLRKLFARTFYQLDKDVAKLANILGHSNIETTRIYIMENGEEHRKQMEKVGLVV